MNKKSQKIIQLNSFSFKILLFTLFIFISTSIYPSPQFDRWGISKDRILKDYITSDVQYVEFSPESKPKYKNRIMNYIIAIDEKLIKTIKILRIESHPLRDFLFVKNKLCSIREHYGVISNNKLNAILKKLTSIYNKPNIQKDKKMSIHTFSNEKTKVLVLSSYRSNRIDCKIYFYASKLFRMLITES